MKSIKMLGLAAFAAAMAMAFIGAASASAESTLLCSTDPASSCTAVSHIHEATLPGFTGELDVECNVLFLGDALGLASPLVIHGSFSYSNCNEGCTVTEENGPAEIRILRTGHETATVVEEFLIHVVCGALVNCRYTGEGMEGTAKGSLLSTEANGEVSFLEQELTVESGTFCPPEFALYLVTTPLRATYIGS